MSPLTVTDTGLLVSAGLNVSVGIEAYLRSNG
jgi:hypothetical protein